MLDRVIKGVFSGSSIRILGDDGIICGGLEAGTYLCLESLQEIRLQHQLDCVEVGVTQHSD